MKLLKKAMLGLGLLVSLSSSRQLTGSGEAAFFDSTAHSDAIRLTMSNVSPPSVGQVYVAWLVADNDTQYTKLGQLTVQGNGNVSMPYKDNSGNNLLAVNKKFVISQETAPFSGNKPSLSAIIFGDSLHGPGIPSSGSPVVRIRNCLATFSNTAQNLGLAVWLKKHINDFIAHSGFARDGAVNNNVGEARTHSDHLYDFITGKLTTLVVGNSSIAANGDAVGYGFRRYGDPGTKDSAQGGAGSKGGAGYHVSLAINDPSATQQMKKAGGSALTAIRNAFGANNDTGWAKQVTDQALKIINQAYTSLPTEGLALYALAEKFINGTVGAADTTSASGGIRQAYYHFQRMATFILQAPGPSSVEHDPNALTPERFILHQNYPNPFNSSTEILFEIPHRSRVRVTVYNILGQEIAALVDGVELSQGIYRTRWDGTSASGLYFCRFQANSLDGAGSFSEARLMILVR